MDAVREGRSATWCQGRNVKIVAIAWLRLIRGVCASNQSLKLANDLYKGGATGFLDVLSAQEVFLRDSDALNRAQREQLAAVALYRSLGGGWSRGDTVSFAALDKPAGK
jgi:hypothetical protein